MRRLNRNLLLFCLLALLLFASVPAFAQDVIVTNTPGELSVQPVDVEAASTQETAATEAAPVPDDSPVVVNIDTPSEVEQLKEVIAAQNQQIATQSQQIAGLQATLQNIWIERFITGGIILVLIYLVFSSNKSLKDMISTEAARGIYKDANEAATKVTDSIPGSIDDIGRQVIFKAFERWINATWGTLPSETAPGVPVPATPAEGSQRTLFTDIAADNG